MSVCSFCCSFIRWFKLFHFNFVCVCGGGGGGIFEFFVQGVASHPFIFSAWMRSLACLLLSSGSESWIWHPIVFKLFFQNSKFLDAVCFYVLYVWLP